MGVQEEAALALAEAGDSTRAQAISDELEKRFPENSLVKMALPTIRAAIELDRNNPARAIELLPPTTAFELLPNLLGSAYIRGRACLLARRGAEAATEFQKVVDQRIVLGVNRRGAVAHLWLARAHVVQGDTAKARAAYQDFLTLWKDADLDIPILIAAKSEYAQLK